MNTNKAIRHFRTGRALLILVMGLIAPFQLAFVPDLAAIQVSDTADVVADDGLCTLREAVIATNTNLPSGGMNGECPAGRDRRTDTITLASGATYSLSIGSTNEDGAADGDLDIWDNQSEVDLKIRVQGGGTATIAQDASPDDRVMHIQGSASVKIEGLILTGGSSVESGGGILNEGILTL
ncbi:MAG TPA: hypothetical protein VJO34_16640, partial [Methylomirabilota bacterium]|nr:hypothetical protein [Methylomirabilota bacterium]